MILKKGIYLTYDIKILITENVFVSCSQFSISTQCHNFQMQMQ